MRGRRDIRTEKSPDSRAFFMERRYLKADICRRICGLAGPNPARMALRLTQEGNREVDKCSSENEYTPRGEPSLKRARCQYNNSEVNGGLSGGITKVSLYVYQ